MFRRAAALLGGALLCGCAGTGPAPGPAAHRAPEPVSRPEEPREESRPESPPPQEGGARDGHGLAARINDEVITWKDVDDRLRLPPGEITPEMRRSKRVELAEEKLFLQWARKCGITATDQEVDEQVRRERKNAFADEEQFEAWLRSTGMTRTEHREQWRRTILAQKLQWHLLRKAALNPDADTPSLAQVQDFVTPTEIRDYYEAHRGQYRAVEHVTYWRIGLQFANAAERERKRALAASLRRKIEEGADFYLLAHYHSDVWRTVEEGGRARREYGDRGLTREEAARFYSPETVKLLFDTLGVGEVSEVVEDGQTFNLFRLEQRVRQKEESFEEVQNRIRSYLENRKREESRRRLRDELVRRSYVWPPDLFEGR